MPRSNRPRDRPDDEDLTHLLSGWKRTEVRRGSEWNVQPISGAAAVKTYVCPSCGQEIAPGTAHVVVWRADGILGDASDLASRRHWHNHCWRAY
jgi:hypothetical protein